MYLNTALYCCHEHFTADWRHTRCWRNTLKETVSPQEEWFHCYSNVCSPGIVRTRAGLHCIWRKVAFVNIDPAFLIVCCVVHDDKKKIMVSSLYKTNNSLRATVATVMSQFLQRMLNISLMSSCHDIWKKSWRLKLMKKCVLWASTQSI